MAPSPILFCSHVVELGGAEHVLCDLWRAIDRERFAPHLAAPHDGPLTELARALDVPVHFVPLAGRGRLAKALAIVRSAPALRRVAAAVGARVLAATSMIAGYAAVRAQRPGLACVWHLHIVTRAAIARRAVARAAAVLAPTRAALEAVGRPDGDVVANGVPERFFQAVGDGLRQRLDVAADAPLFGMVGRIDPRKGHDVMLDALTELPGAHLAIAGAELFVGTQKRLGGYGERLKAKAEARGLTARVHWLGPVGDPAPLYPELDALVLPSTGVECAPRSIAEAQAAGCPVVASALGGIPEMLEGGSTGRLVPPGDAGALAAALRDLAADRGTRARLAATARRHAEQHYGMAAFAAGCEAVFARVATGTGSAPADTRAPDGQP